MLAILLLTSAALAVDSDGDGINDKKEQASGTDPHDATDTPGDIDKDGKPKGTFAAGMDIFATATKYTAVGSAGFGVFSCCSLGG